MYKAYIKRQRLAFLLHKVNGVAQLGQLRQLAVAVVEASGKKQIHFDWMIDCTLPFTAR